MIPSAAQIRTRFALGETAEEAGRALGCSRWTVNKYARLYGIPTRRQGECKHRPDNLGREGRLRGSAKGYAASVRDNRGRFIDL